MTREMAYTYRRGSNRGLIRTISDQWHNSSVTLRSLFDVTQHGASCQRRPFGGNGRQSVFWEGTDHAHAVT